MAKRPLLVAALLMILFVPILFLTLLAPETLPVPVVQQYPPSLRRYVATNTATKSLLDRGKTSQKAKRLLEFALAVDPDNTRGLGIACQGYEPSIGLQYCRRLVALEPNEQSGWDVLADTLRKTGRFEEADAITLRQLQLHPCSWWGYSDYWESMRRQGKRERSIPILQSGMGVRDQCDAHHVDGMFPQLVVEPLIAEFLAAKRYDEAVETGRLLVAEPNGGDSEISLRHLFLAIALDGKGDQTSAHAEYERSARIGPCQFIEDKDYKLRTRCAGQK